MWPEWFADPRCDELIKSEFELTSVYKDQKFQQISLLAYA